MVPTPVQDTQAMIAGMAPHLDPEIYVFCSVTNPEDAAPLHAQALATFVEAEGQTLILPLSAATEAGFATDLPMRRITLTVHSSLDGVGLTAAVATALAGAGIPCNMVAAYHHDHAFVPASRADEALSILQSRARAAHPTKGPAK
jgi:hypothetical protein